MYQKITEEMLAFLKNSPTTFHAVESAKELLKKNGYEELRETESWNLEVGKNYFVTRNGTSIIAFQMRNGSCFNIVASHTDSPMFKIKEKAEITVNGKYTKLNTEGYGGMISSTWFDRPLSVAGRVMVRIGDGSIVTKLLNFDRDLVMIPNVAIHMNRDINKGYTYNNQIDLLPLFSGEKEENGFRELVAEELGVSCEDVLGTDLFVYNRTAPSVWGKHNEFISSARLDDLQCAFSSLKALLGAENEKSINVMACFDNEEVGSTSRQGAASTFLRDVLKRISLALGKDEGEFMRMLAGSFMLSADNAHAVHPNHPEYTDQTNNTYMNEGVVVKSHAAQKYCSDGLTVAAIKQIAANHEIPLQFFANRSDKVGGGTLGNIAMTQVSLNCVDIGIPQLAMHSAYETAGMKDTLHMVNLMRAFYNTHIEFTEEGMRLM